MRWLCMFRQCRWIWHVNIDGIGIYQCARCKTISVGGPGSDSQ